MEKGSDKKELNIIALSRSNSSEGNYVIVLEEAKGFRRIPIIIGTFEAQAIAIALESMPTDRPQTHDLTLNILQLSEFQLVEVIIADYREEVFFAQLVMDTPHGREVLDARSSDAIALATRKPCPIYTYEHVLEATGVVLDSPGLSFGEKRRSIEDYSVEELKGLLQRLIEKEDYESANKLKEIIRKKTSGNP